MTDIIFSAPDYDTLLSEATTLGFVSEDSEIITNGTFESGGGWFLNIVGTVYEPLVDETTPPLAREGYWGRLRLNGVLESLPHFSANIVQYVWNEDLGGWTSDGVTVAPDWVSNIGVVL